MNRNMPGHVLEYEQPQRALQKTINSRNDDMLPRVGLIMSGSAMFFQCWITVYGVISTLDQHRVYG